MSFDLKNTITKPFEISFKDILEGKIDISFTGNTFEINNLNADLIYPEIGKFIVKMYQFKMTRQSNVNFAFMVENTDDETMITCVVDVSNGVEIRGLIIGYNDFLYPLEDIIINGYYHHEYSLSIVDANVDFFISEDQSYGYVKISGGLILTL